MTRPDPTDHTIGHSFAAKDEDGERFTCKLCNRHISEHPDKEVALAIQEWDDILQYGHQVRYVFPTAEDEGHFFAYSVGRCVYYKPEILMTGPLRAEVMMSLVNDAARLMDEGKLEAGKECHELLQGYPVRVVQVRDLEEAQMFGCTRIDPDATAVQVIWPDIDGRFPGDAGYEYGEDVQPVFD